MIAILFFSAISRKFLSFIAFLPLNLFSVSVISITRGCDGPGPCQQQQMQGMPRQRTMNDSPTMTAVDSEPQPSDQTISGATSGCGATGADPVACGRASVLRGQSHIGIPAACFNRVDSGPCSQDLIRIYYDYTTYTCKAFSYSGCGGNANRFVSIKNCYKLCHPYYRQRFINLGIPRDNTNEEEGSNKGSSTEGPSTEESSSEESSTEESSSEESSTEESSTEETTTTEPTTTTTEEDRGVLYFNSLSGEKTEVKPEIQVVHEYDTFEQPQPNPNYAPPPGYGQQQGYGQQPPYGQQPQYPQPMNPMVRSMDGQGGGGPPGGAPGGQSNHGYLENIQAEDYKPMGGYLKTPQGVKSSPQNEQRIVYT